KGHTGTVYGIAFSPAGNTIATCADDQTVRLWDVATGQERMTLGGFASGVRAVAFSPDGNTLAAGSTDGLIRVWHAPRGLEAVAFAPSPKEISPEADEAVR